MQIGTWVFDKISGCEVKILSVETLFGMKNIEVYDPVNKSVYTRSEEDLKESHMQDVTQMLYGFYYQTLVGKFKNDMSGAVLSSTDDSIIPLPHQVYAISRVMEGDKIRYLMADEVGLGKTIEAGMVIKELKERGLINRILVVAPKGLMLQWRDELSSKFSENFNIVLPESFESIKMLYNTQDVWKNFDQVICSIDSVKPLEKRAGWSEEKIKAYNDDRMKALVHGNWDLIIIDEAHRLAGSSSDVARYKLGKGLADASPYLLLLTATPHSGKTESFLRLMQLLDKDAFPNVNAVVKEQVGPYIIRSEKRTATNNDGELLFKKRKTKTVNVSWQIRHSDQEVLYHAVSKYVQDGYNKSRREKKAYIGFLMILMQRLMSSSTYAIRSFIERRIELLQSEVTKRVNIDFNSINEEDGESLLEEIVNTESKNIKKELEELDTLLILAKRAENQYIDVKLERLAQYLNDNDFKETKEKVIIFTEFVKTQEYLRKYLEKEGYTVATLNGSLNLMERTKVVEEFRNNHQILISTDAGGEGLNLQFCSTLFNYDLPWNPMKIEQRIGRVDRIGQEKDVNIFNFIIEDTVEFRVRTVLEEKLRIIFEEFGVDKMEDVLDAGDNEVDFTEVFVDTVISGKDIDYRTNKITAIVKDKTQKAVGMQDIIRDVRQDEKENLKDMQVVPIKAYLTLMYDYYKTFRDEEINIAEKALLKLSSPIVEKMLEELQYDIHPKEILYLKLEGINYEKGIWSLWEISISDRKDSKYYFPMFLNEDFVFRYGASNLLWEIFLNKKQNIQVQGTYRLEDEIVNKLYDSAREHGQVHFEEKRNEIEDKIAQEERKLRYAMKLRKEAIESIGLEQVKNYRLKKVQKEQEELEQMLKMQKRIIPKLTPVCFAKVGE